MMALFESTSIDSQRDSLLNQDGLYTSSTLATVTLHCTIASWMRATLMERRFVIIVLSVDRLAGCCGALGSRPSDLQISDPSTAIGSFKVVTAPVCVRWHPIHPVTF